MRRNKYGGIVLGSGAIILLVGILMLVGVVPAFGLSTVAGTCGTWTTVNPLSTAQGSPSTFNTGQAQQLASRFTLGSGCTVNTTFGIGVSAQCISGCGSAGTGFALNGCSNCAAQNSAPATIDASGNINYVWGTSSGTNQPIGTGSYPAGALISVVFSLSAFQASSQTSSTNTLTVYGQFVAGITGSAFDFQIAASPTGVTAGGSGTASSTITITPLNGYPGPTALAVACSSTSLNPCSLSLTSVGSSGSTTLTVGGNTAGSYTATVTGTYSSTSGNIVHSTTVAITISSSSGSTTPDFTMTTPSSFVAFPVGNTVQIPITIQSLNGFAGTVVLSASAATNSIGGSCLSSIGSTVLGAGGSATLTLSLSASSAGTFTCTLTGSVGSLSHTLSVVSTLSTAFGTFPLAYILIAIGVLIMVVGVAPVYRRRR
jgi:hypothetical protein